MITYRRMKLSEIERIAEVDRTEHVAKAYRQIGDELEPFDVEWNAPPWSVPEMIEEWDLFLRDDCALWGAFDGERLVGFCGYRPNVAPGVGQFSLLHVSSTYRRQGIGRRLAETLFAHAKGEPITGLYLTATPTRGTVAFYGSLGFRPTDNPLPELLEMEPDDIHMVMALPTPG